MAINTMNDEPMTTADLVNENRTRTAAPAEINGRVALFQSSETERFRSRWHDIQGNFVDEPRHSVEQADELVASVIKRLAEVFADERARLEKDWEKGEDVSTEDLRQALQRYRSFFDRLLSV